jgi:outer membrane protein
LHVSVKQETEMKKHVSPYFILLIVMSIAAAKGQTEKISLKDTEVWALKSSYNTKALEAEGNAIGNKMSAQRSLLFPKISFDATYKYLSEVPELNFPGGAKAAFGDNQNYSVGPILTWTVWDFGSARKTVKGIESQGASKKHEKNLSNRQILLSARLAYFKIQLRTEQKRLVGDSLKLAESQYRDIQNRTKAGSANRIDLLSSHKEVLNFKLQFRQIQSDLSSDIRDLYALIGKNNSNESSTSVEVDSILSSLKELSDKYGDNQLDDAKLGQHPLIKMHTANMESNRLIAESFKANQLPKLSLFLKSSLDYPNGPVLEQINQNTIGVALTMPLFEGGKSSNESAEKENLARSFESRQNQARIDIIRDWNKAKDQLNGLRDKSGIYKNSVSESLEHAKLIYSSYRAGKTSFLEVQTANLHALETMVQSTTNDVQMLIQLAYLASISEGL